LGGVNTKTEKIELKGQFTEELRSNLAAEFGDVFVFAEAKPSDVNILIQEAVDKTYGTQKPQ